MNGYRLWGMESLKGVFSHVKYVGISFLVICFLYVVSGTYLFTTQSIDAQNAKLLEPITITLADVYGNNLPPAPTSVEIDATIEGPDKNKNHIRDDVELAIHAEYVNDEKLRAASLQYAQALQLLLTKVGGEETMRVVLYKDSDGTGCISDVLPGLTEEERLSEDEEVARVASARVTALWEEKTSFVENLQFNSQVRLDTKKEVYKKYMTSAGGNIKSCALDL